MEPATKAATITPRLLEVQRKIDLVCMNLNGTCRRSFSKLSDQNAEILADYILAEKKDTVASFVMQHKERLCNFSLF
jgi:hypothetical protein